MRYRSPLPLLSIVLFFISSVALMAGAPHAVILGPTAGGPGDLIELDGSKSTGDNFKWTLQNLVNPEKVWIRESDDHKKAIISNYPGGHYRVQLIVSNVDGIDTCEWFVKISGNLSPTPIPNPIPNPQPIPPTPNPIPNPQPVPPGPTPIPPNPTPNPTPNPPTPTPTPPNPEPKPVPEGEFGIAPKIVEWSKLVNTPDRAGQAKKLSEGLKTIQSRIAAGTLKDPQSIIYAMRDANVSFLGDDLSKWKEFGMRLMNELSQLFKDGKINRDPMVWARLLMEIIIGLQSIR